MYLFHFTVRGMPTYGREREYFLFVLKPKIPKQQSWTNKNQRQATLSNLISLFWKQSKGEESLFLKEKQEAHYMHMHSIFYFAYNIDRSNLKLHYFFYFDEIVLMQKRQKNIKNLKACEANQRSNVLCSMMIMT